MSKGNPRTLTAAEARRLAHFDELCTSLQAQGYRKVDLTIDVKKATVITLVATVPLLVLYFVLFVWLNPNARIGMDSFEALLLFVALIVLVVVHELVHGITWSLFSEHGMKDIEFGVMRNTLSPYCTCSSALPRDKYLIGALMPLVLLGIIPSIVALATGSFWLLILGLIMTTSAGGDVMIVAKLLAYKTNAAEVLWYDHPTEGGGVLFER